MAKNLSPKILEFLKKKLNLTEATVRYYIAQEKISCPNITSNAAAQLFALKRKINILSKLDKEDKETLPNLDIKKVRTVIIPQKDRKNTKIKIPCKITYNTSDRFKKGHVDEFNRAYYYKCFTSCFFLARKIVENLIIDILKIKFPQERGLYWDDSRRRFLDLSIILDNLNKKRGDFGTDSKLVERIYQKVKPFKDDANDKAHSWFHLVENKTEIDNMNIEFIISLIEKLEKS
jgi:hypothetical protein